MSYEDALKRWGKRRLESRYPKRSFDINDVIVMHNFNEGYSCNCNDPDCYDSFAEPASFDLTVEAKNSYYTMSLKYDFDEFLRQLLEEE